MCEFVVHFLFHIFGNYTFSLCVFITTKGIFWSMIEVTPKCH